MRLTLESSYWLSVIGFVWVFEALQQNQNQRIWAIFVYILKKLFVNLTYSSKNKFAYDYLYDKVYKFYF